MSGTLLRMYLIRRGEPDWTISSQHTGFTDILIDERSEREAREVGACLTALRVDRILSSPRQAARRTAEPATQRSWVAIGLAPTEGRRLLLATGCSSVLGYDHNLIEPVNMPAMAAAQPSRLRSGMESSSEDASD